MTVPHCPKCGGYIVSDRALSGRLVSIGCVNCVNRRWTGFIIRRPTHGETVNRPDKGATKRRTNGG